jgi:hypothetical protein
MDFLVGGSGDKVIEGFALGKPIPIGIFESAIVCLKLRERTAVALSTTILTHHF